MAMARSSKLHELQGMLMHPFRLLQAEGDFSMRQKRNSRCILFVFVAILFFSSSCATALRNKQLETVAKDWALVIRASQVIPVYPLTEDLQPGDVLLVSMPVEEQVKIYKDKGYLPLDQLLTRLYTKDHHTKNFYNFYNGRYGIDENSMPPEQWQKASEKNKHHWAIAPLAAFPPYQFSVNTGSGVNLAIPIQGVPFALGLMNSGSASGSLSITEAYTFGLDNCNLEQEVKDWSSNHRNILRNYEPQGDKDKKKYHFLRVISRIYVASSVNVTLHNDESVSGETAAGADRPVNLMGIKENATPENYSNAITAMNNLLKEQIPGVKAKIATASSRSVTFKQDFDRPLVIGYIGFDMPILKGGRLGAPISTLSQLTDTITLPPAEMGDANLYRLASLSHMNKALQELKKNGIKDAEDISNNLDKLSSLLPDKYPFTGYHRPSPDAFECVHGAEEGDAVNKQNGFGDVIDYIGYAGTSREFLAKCPDTAQQVADCRKKNVIDCKQELQKVQSAINDLETRLSGDPALMEAIEFTFLGK